jgi:cyclic 2,3-diphosphoglycerate synthetase
LLLADLVVFTMWEDTLDRAQRAAVERCALGRPLSQPRVVCTVFRPHPLGDVTGKKIWFGTTANERAGPTLKQHLERTYGCEVVAVSHALARRDRLRSDLEAAVRRPERPGAGGAGRIDALVVELKAAAVDVVTRWGVERGIEVIYLDNRPEVVAGDGPLDELLVQTAEAARERFGR